MLLTLKLSGFFQMKKNQAIIQATRLMPGEDRIPHGRFFLIILCSYFLAAA